MSLLGSFAMVLIVYFNSLTIISIDFESFCLETFQIIHTYILIVNSIVSFWKYSNMNIALYKPNTINNGLLVFAIIIIV